MNVYIQDHTFFDFDKMSRKRRDNAFCFLTCTKFFAENSSFK